MLHLGDMRESGRLMRQLINDLPQIRSSRLKAQVLYELAYQARHHSLSSEVEYLEEARSLVPAEESRLRFFLLDDHLDNQESSPSEKPTEVLRKQLLEYRKQLLEFLSESQQIGKFASKIADVVFGADAEWAAVLLHQQAGGSTPAEGLRRLARTLGAVQSTINVLSRVARAEADTALAAKDIRFAMQIAESLHLASYAVYVANMAAGRFIKWKRWKAPEEDRSSNELALRWIGRGLAAAGTNSPSTSLLLLILDQAATYFLLDLSSDAIKTAKYAQQLAIQLDRPVERVSACIQEGCFSFRAGDLLQAAGALQTARSLWSDRYAAGTSAPKQTLEHPFAFGYIGLLILDACEWFKGRTSDDLSPAESSFIDDIVWFASDFYMPRLPESGDETDWINDLWYAVSQVKDLPLQNVIAAYDALADAERKRNPGGKLNEVFRVASERLKDLRDQRR